MIENLATFNNVSLYSPSCALNNSIHNENTSGIQPIVMQIFPQIAAVFAGILSACSSKSFDNERNKLAVLSGLSAWVLITYALDSLESQYSLPIT